MLGLFAEGTSTLEGIGIGTAITAAGALLFRYWERNDNNRVRSETKEEKKRDDTIAEYKNLIARQDERLEEFEARLSRSERTERRCGRRLERAETTIEYLQEALRSAGISFRVYAPSVDVDDSGEHPALPHGERRHHHSPHYRGPERRDPSNPGGKDDGE